MTKKDLSYSGYSTYVTCPKKYDYHYNQKLRPLTEPYHLMFGKAVDVALNELLVNPEQFDKGLELAKTELMRLFVEPITFEEKDFDTDLYSDLTTEPLINKLRSTGWNGDSPANLASVLFSQMNMGDSLSDNQKKALKYLLYFSAVEKIFLMMNSFVEYVLPQIEEIHSVQKRVKRGIIDFEATFKGIGLVTVDNKTTSWPYDSEAVKWSVQLAGYEAKKAMYIVFNKNIKKNKTKICFKCNKNGTGQRHKTCDADILGTRCGGDWIETIIPEVIPQIIIDDVPERNREIVEEAYSEVEKAIEANCFPRNLTNCQKQYGRPCEFINLCWFNKMDGLKINEK